MKQCGIWLDGSKAILVYLENGQCITEEIDSNLENYHPKGGSRSKVPYGPMEKISESKYLERKKQQFKRYFASISEKLKNTEEIYLFGPGQTKLKFKEFLKSISKDNLTVSTSQKLTSNQIIAEVKAHFNVN